MSDAHRTVLVAALVRVVLASTVLAAVPTPESGDRGLRIMRPSDGTLFPPQSVAPTFVWKDETPDVDRWDVVVRDEAGAEIVRAWVTAPTWQPSEDDWRRIKQRSAERDAEVVVDGFDPAKRATVSSARVRIRTSRDSKPEEGVR